jgi:hypothetical protein
MQHYVVPEISLLFQTAPKIPPSQVLRGGVALSSSVGEHAGAGGIGRALS